MRMQPPRQTRKTEPASGSLKKRRQPAPQKRIRPIAVLLTAIAVCICGFIPLHATKTHSYDHLFAHQLPYHADPDRDPRQSHAEKTRMLISQADSAFSQNSYEIAFHAYNTAAEAIESGDLPSRWRLELSHCYLQLGKVCYFIGRYDDGIFYMYELLKNRTASPAEMAEAHLLLGNMYMRLEKNSIAQKHLDEAQTLIDRLQGKSASDLHCRLQICRASVAIQENALQEAETFIHEARKLNLDSAHSGLIFQNIAVLNYMKGDIRKAFDYYQKAIDHAESLYSKSVLLNNLAILCIEQGDFRQAMSVLAENEQLAQHIGANHVQGNLYSIYAQLYTAQGDYKKALGYRQKEQELIDSLIGNESEERIMTLTNKYETVKLQYEKEKVEHQLQTAKLNELKKNMVIGVLLILSAGITFLVVMAIRRIRRQKSRNSELSTELKRMDEKNRIMETSKSKAEHEVSTKVRELTANTMYIAKMCDVANRTLKDIEALSPYCTDEDAQIILKRIRQEIHSLTVEEKGWRDFKLYFESMHPSFFSRLHKSYPNLTSIENRLCAFIVMNLSTKEIAALTNRSIRSVETAKFRLRKKLDIETGTTTLSFLSRYIEGVTE